MGVKVFISGQNGDIQVGHILEKTLVNIPQFQTKANGDVIVTRLQELGVAFVKVKKFVF